MGFYFKTLDNFYKRVNAPNLFFDMINAEIIPTFRGILYS